MAPRLMAWAVVAIRLYAAWRNTSVRRTSAMRISSVHSRFRHIAFQ